MTSAIFILILCGYLIDFATAHQEWFFNDTLFTGEITIEDMLLDEVADGHADQISV